MQRVKREVKNLLVSAGVKGDIELTTPPNAEMGDFAFACFGVAKELSTNPKEAAEQIAVKIKGKKSRMIERVEAMGPYVNFFLKSSEVAAMVIKKIDKQGKKYGYNELGLGKKVLIEYPSNNTHKEFHIGHLRNVCIGNTLVQLYAKSGYKVFPVNYLNDFGNHVAKCLWGLLKFHKNEKPPANKQKWLGDIYAEASQQVRDNPDFGKEVADLQKKIEERDPEIWPLFMETREWSIEQFDKIFKQLNVKHSAVFYEKNLKDNGQKMTDDLVQRGVAEVGEGGAIIVDLSKYNLDVALLRKSNGAGLYLTSDLPLAVEKFAKFDVDESIVVTGTEQNHYFKQLYKILELIGFKKKLTHIGYGLVNLKEGKMSSRLGNVILYEDLRDEVFEKLKIESTQRHPEWSKKKIDEAAYILTMAALKFDMQKHEAAKNITFDIKEATSFDGFTGPYILYVIARINSLAAKAKGKKKIDETTVRLLDKPEEKKLLLFLSRYEEVVVEALQNYNPSAITRYCFDVAQQFNVFYNKHSVLSAESKDLISARLQLCGAVKNVLENALGLLTIDTVEEM